MPVHDPGWRATPLLNALLQADRGAVTGTRALFQAIRHGAHDERIAVESSNWLPGLTVPGTCVLC